jgi:putative ABC transport system substrate-binding protein
MAALFYLSDQIGKKRLTIGERPYMSYGPDLRDVTRRSASYVAKILKGTKPSDLPVEEISKFDLVIDLRLAHELGINVPQELLFRADEVMR